MSENGACRISVIVATYNAAGTLDHCLRSIIAQTCPAVEVIVIDGGSSDGTQAIIEARANRLAYWESAPDRGIYHAWNKGLGKARGEWICFLGADDYFWSADALQRMTRCLDAVDPACRVVYGRVAVTNADGALLYEVGEDWSRAGPGFHDCMTIPHPGLMHRRDLFKELGTFDESYRIAGDYEMLLRELRQAPALFADIGQPLVGMRVGGISSTPHQALLQLREVRRAQKSLGFDRPGRRWMMAMTRVHIRLMLWRLIGERTTRKLLDVGRRLQGKPPFWTRT